MLAVRFPTRACQVLTYQEYREIEERLRGDLEKARSEYQAACGEFDSLVKDIPNGIPQADGGLHLRQSGEASRAALQTYTVALKRFSQYTLSGIVPEDLLPPRPMPFPDYTVTDTVPKDLLPPE
jgi:hypothetical protein